jgi:hypothetical protein
MKSLLLILFLLITSAVFGQATKAQRGNLEIRNYNNETKASIDTNGVVKAVVYANETVYSIPGSSIDWKNGNFQKKILTSNVIFTFDNPLYTSMTLVIKNDGVARTITWPAGIKWKDNIPPVQTVTAFKRDVYTIIPDGDGGFLGAYIQNF